MIAFAIAFGVVGLAVVLAVHDTFRRALAAQVRQAELRVEAMQRADYDAAAKRMDALEARIKALASDHASLENGLAMRGARR
jgi:cell division protein FtsB